MSPLLPSAALWAAIAGAAMSAPPPCEGVAKRVRGEVESRPERVLIIVEDAIVQSEACACEVVTAAIEATGARVEVVGQIVFAAVSCSPAMAATVVECAAGAAPHATAEIRAAVKKAFEDQPREVLARALSPLDPGTRPEASKAGAAPTPAEVRAPAPKQSVAGSGNEADWGGDWGLGAVAIGGIYLIVPNGTPGGVDAAGLRRHPASQSGQRPRTPRPRVIIIRPPDATPVASAESLESPSAN